MSQLLEAGMLLCFGISWPLSLVKNIRARTTQNMSLGFILLITLGYIAGISAKLMNGQAGYVLIVYVFNLVVVAANLGVYVRNLRCDREAVSADKPATEKEEPSHAAKYGNKRAMMYRELNKMADNNGIVFFGTQSFSQIPFNELEQTFGLSERIYNRSVENVCIDEANKMFSSCVLPLKPSKVFVNLGEEDLNSDAFRMDSFLSKYEWLLYTIHTETHADTCIVSVMADTPAARELNSKLRRLAQEHGCDFIDIVPALYTASPAIHAFELMEFYIRSHPLDFADAMNMVTA